VNKKGKVQMVERRDTQYTFISEQSNKS